MYDDDFSGATWRKSTRSGNATAECVEVAATAASIAVRDSKDPHGGMLIFNRAQWNAFITDVTQPPSNGSAPSAGRTARTRQTPGRPA